VATHDGMPDAVRVIKRQRTTVRILGTMLSFAARNAKAGLQLHTSIST
jgi:hypothetical protein